MAKITIESPEKRFQRFQKAKDSADLWIDILEDAYRHVLPYKNIFHRRTKGEQLNEDIFDATGEVALQNFANNIQFVMMPPFRQWAVLEAGPEVPKANKRQVDEALQDINNKLFRFIDESNFLLTVNETLQEYGISTGVLIVNEGKGDSPLEFVAVPIASIAFEEGRYGSIQNFWREWKLPIEVVVQNWPEAKLPEEMRRKLNDNPQERVELIEGTIEYPDNPEGKRIYYYVQIKGTKKDIITEFRDFSPWIAFRFSKAPNETYGRGPAMMAMPFIKTANKMVEFNLRAAKFKAWPIYIASDTGIVNPFNLDLVPGAIIPAEPNFMSTLPIQPLPNAGDVRFAELSLLDTRNAIKELMFASPLPAAPTPNVTATQISLLQNEWIRRNAAAFTRLTVELIRPVIDKSLVILRKKGLIPDIRIDGKEIGIRYESPLIQIQAQEDIQKTQQWLALIAQEFGPFGLIGVNADKLPEWYAEKLGVDMTLVKESGMTKEDFLNFIERVQQQQQQEPQVPLGGVEAPSAG